MSYLFRILILLGIFSINQLDLTACSGLGQPGNGFEGVIRFQMKSSMEDIKTGSLPEFMEYHIKGDDIVIQMIGNNDIKMARILIKGDQSTFYMIDDDAMTAMKVRVNDAEAENQIGNVPEEFREEYEKALNEAASKPESEKVDLKETGETLNIQGYECTKYIVTAEAGEAFVESEVWLTEKIRVNIPGVLKDNNNPLLLFMNEKGFPLRFTGESKSNGRDYSFEIVAVKVAPGNLNPAYFDIPEDYHISDMTSLLER